MENSFGQMVGNTKEIGKMENNTVEGYIKELLDNKRKENG